MTLSLWENECQLRAMPHWDPPQHYSYFMSALDGLWQAVLPHSYDLLSVEMEPRNP